MFLHLFLPPKTSLRLLPSLHADRVKGDNRFNIFVQDFIFMSDILLIRYDLVGDSVSYSDVTKQTVQI